MDIKTNIKSANLKWNTLPTHYFEAPYVGNGQVGTIFWKDDDGNLMFEMGRSDFYDHRNESYEILYRDNRLKTGKLTLGIDSLPLDGNMVMDLYDAQILGTLKTDKSEMKIRVFNCDDRDVIVIELEKVSGECDFSLDYTPYVCESPRIDWKPLEGYKPYPPAVKSESDGVKLWVQSLPEDEVYNNVGKVDAEFALAMLKEEDGIITRFYISMRYSYPGTDAHIQAKDEVKSAQDCLNDDNNNNPERALPLFYKAAKMGDARAAYECGKYAMQGFFDMGKAKAKQYFYMMADEQEKALKKLEKKFFKEALKWFKLSAKLGCAEALAMTGYFYHYGLYPVSKDEEKAFEIYNKAREMGSVEAMAGLGVCYVTAKGTKRDSKMGLDLLFEASDKGSAEAVYQLSRFYKIGLGFGEKDEEEAFRLALEAAELKHPAATFAVGKHYLEGIGVKKNVKAAIEWIEKARHEYCYFRQITEDEFLEIDDNFRIRCNQSFELAKKYEKENDDVRAIEQYRIAAEYGAYEYKYNLGRLLHDTSTEAHCDKEAMVYLCEVAEKSDSFGTKAAGLVREIINDYAIPPSIFECPLGSLSAENIYKNLSLLCNIIRGFMPDEDKPRFVEPCQNKEAERLYIIARKAEIQGEHFDLAIEGYREAAELGHTEALFRCLQLSKRTGDISTELDCKELFRTRTHPRYPFHLPSLLVLAQEVDVEALTELADYFTVSYFRNADIAACFNTVAAQIYALRAINHNDAEAAYYLEKSLNKYLCAVDRRDWTQTEGYYNYGFVYYDKAINSESDEYTKEDVELAKRAVEAGIPRANRVELAYERNRERRSRIVTQQREYRRKALENYIYSLDEKERSFNLYTEGEYRTEQEAYLLGARDYLTADWYQKIREKKIKDFEESLNNTDD